MPLVDNILYPFPQARDCRISAASNACRRVSGFSSHCSAHRRYGRPLDGGMSQGRGVRRPVQTPSFVPKWSHTNQKLMTFFHLDIPLASCPFFLEEIFGPGANIGIVRRVFRLSGVVVCVSGCRWVLLPPSKCLYHVPVHPYHFEHTPCAHSFIACPRDLRPSHIRDLA